MRTIATGTILALALAMSAFADDVVTVSITGVNGQTANGFFVSPIFGTVNGVDENLWCDDLLDPLSIGQTYQATVAAVGKFAASLYPALFAIVDTATPVTLVYHQEAMWQLTDPDYTGTVLSNIVLQNAIAHPYTGTNYNVLVAPAGIQELIVDSITAAPELGTRWLLVIAIGLMSLKFLGRRKLIG